MAILKKTMEVIGDMTNYWANDPMLGTPKPWCTEKFGESGWEIYGGDGGENFNRVVAKVYRKPDAEAIVYAVNIAPKLAAALDEAIQYIDTLVRCNEPWRMEIANRCKAEIEKIISGGFNPQ